MDEGLIIVLDYDKICRLCLQSRGVLTDLFIEENNDLNDEVPLRKQIELLTSIDIAFSEALPKKICHKCRYEVELGYQMRETVIKTHQLLSQADEMDADRLSEVVDSNSFLKIKEEENVSAKDGFNDELYQPNVKENLEYDLADLQEKAENNECTSSEKSIRRKKSSSAPTLVCQVCLVQFEDIFNFTEHISLHYVDFPALTPYHIAQKPYKCALCDGQQRFSFRSELVVHHRFHLNINPYRCQMEGCNNVFRSKDMLRQHSYTHGEKKFVCEVCGSAFRRIGELKQHNLRHQDEGTFYQCKLCKVVCKNRLSYKAHMKHHETGKRFKCLRIGCPKAFFSKTDLEVHERSHTNDKRYKCTLCVCAYISQSQLNRHLKQHERRKVMKCDKCVLSFNNYSDFCNHRINTHGDWLPYRCRYCKQGYQNMRTMERHINRCKNREDLLRIGDHEMDHAILENFDRSHIRRKDDLVLDDDSLQNDPESSFLYIIDMDSQDGGDIGSKTSLDSEQGQHYMIIQDVDEDGEKQCHEIVDEDTACNSDTHFESTLMKDSDEG